jgi:hypothetical protein
MITGHAAFCVGLRSPGAGGEQSQCQVMMNDAELASVPPAPFTDQLRLAEVAYIANVGPLHGDHESLQRQSMTTFTQLSPIPSSADAGVRQAEAERLDIAADSVRLRRSRNDRY